MIPDNSRKKFEQLRQEMALRAQLQQQYDKEMSGKYTKDMPSFAEWMAQRQQKPMAKGGTAKRHNFIKHKQGEKVGGYDVGEKIKNYGSYSASGINDIEQGIHRVPMSAFEVTHPNKLFYAKNDIDHVHRLAEQIKQNKYMDPLLVAMDKKGAYVLEGGHRLGAAHLLGMKEVPAMIGHEPEDYATGGSIHMSNGGEPTQDAMRLALSKAKRHGMYSPLEMLAVDIPRNKGTGAEFMAEISKQKGFKPEEVADRKIPIPEGKMTKLEFLKHLRQHSLPPLQEFEMPNMGTGTEARNDRANDYYGDDFENLSPEQQIDVRDWVRKHNAKFPQYQIPGGENYRELLLKLPAADPKDLSRINYLQIEKRRTDPTEWANSEDAKTLDALMEKAKKFPTPYQSGHWRAHPNVLAHVRLSDREGPDGKKLLHVEELQSDWHQQGRKNGYKRSEEELQSEHMRLIQEHEAKIKQESKRLSDEFKAIKQRLRNADPDSDEARLLQGQEIMTLRQLTALSEAEEPPKPKDYGVPQAPFKKSWHELGMKHVLHHAAKHGYQGVVITPGQEQAERWGDEGLKVHYDKKIPEFLNKFGKPFGAQVGTKDIQAIGDNPPSISPIAHGRFMVEHDGNSKTFWSQDEANQYAKSLINKSVHHFPITEPMREKILKEGMPQYMRGGIIHKAEGGKVQPSIAQMRVALKNRSPIELQSVGVNEAPNMSPKVYMPPEKEDSVFPAPGGVATSSGMPIGGVDMSKLQGGQQLMPQPLPPQAPPQPPQGAPMPQGGQPQGQPPMGAQQGGGSILQMTPQGQMMAALGGAQPPQKPQGLAKGGKVDVRPTVFDDKAVRRHPEIETAAKMLVAGHIKQKEFDRVVQKHKPVKPYDFVPTPATDEQAMDSLDKNQKLRWRDHEQWPSGHRVGLRLDIPSYEKKGVWVNSIHDESGQKPAFKVSYGPVSSVRNAEFHGTPHKAVEVATGEKGKSPFAKIVGDLEHITEDEAVAHMVKHLKHPDYRQVGYDPRRHGDFYDRETMQPVTHSEHVVQIGPLVLAKNPKYGKRTLYKDGGRAYAEGGGVTVSGATGTGGFDLHIPINVGGGSNGGSGGGSGGGISSLGGMMGQSNASSAPSASPPPQPSTPYGMYTSRPQQTAPQQNFGSMAPPSSLAGMIGGQPPTNQFGLQTGYSQYNPSADSKLNNEHVTQPNLPPMYDATGNLEFTRGIQSDRSVSAGLYGGSAPPKTYMTMTEMRNNPKYQQQMMYGIDPNTGGDFISSNYDPNGNYIGDQGGDTKILANSFYAEGGNVKKPTVAEMKEAIFQKAQEGLMRPSEVLGKHEGKFMHITEADRAKVEKRLHGMRGGVGFSQIGLEDPNYAGRVWGVGKSGTAIKLLNRQKRGLSPEDQAIWTTFIGTPEMHTSNQLVFNRMWNKFQEARKKGLLSPEQEAQMLDLIRSAMTKGTEKNPSKAVFDPDVSFDNTHHLFDTFERRRILSDLMSGKKIGGKKAQIFDASKMIEDTTDPRLLHAPTLSVGPHVFSFSGETSHEPHLNKAFPFMLHGETSPDAFRQIPFKIAAPDYTEEIRKAKGREPGYMDIVRRIPRQQLTEKYLTSLQKQGYKKGGKVKLQADQDSMRLALTRKK